MLIAAGIVLFIIWLVAFLVFHVASFLIHILLLAAVIAVVVHFIRGSKRTS